MYFSPPDHAPRSCCSVHVFRSLSFGSQLLRNGPQANSNHGLLVRWTLLLPPLLAPCNNLNVVNWFFVLWQKPVWWGCSAACNTETLTQRGKFMPEPASLHNQPLSNGATGCDPATITQELHLLFSCLTNSFSGNLHKQTTVLCASK